MKKFISKIRNKRLKGNVSLLVILILLASSVIALLSISQIQHLITYWNMTFNYFRAFYLAKAGTEFWLTEVYNRENWFEDKILNEEKNDGSIDFDPIIAKNFLWSDNEYEWAKPYFNMEIKSNFNIIGNDVRYDCNKDNKITLDPKSEENPWGWLVLSLFKDNTSGLKNILNPDYVGGISPLSDSTVKSIKFDKNPSWDLMFWLFNYDMTNIHVVKWKKDNPNDEWKDYSNDINKFLNDYIWSIEWVRKYLTIKNRWSTPVSFCIGNNIPYSDYLVTVRGNYADMEVWLKSIVKKEIPSWSLDVLWWD